MSKRKIILVLIALVFSISILFVFFGDAFLFRFAMEFQIRDKYQWAYKSYITILDYFPKTSYSDLVKKNLSFIVKKEPQLESCAKNDSEVIEKVFPDFFKNHKDEQGN
ncbi:MAG: hypothetical protein AB1403_00265 [Candidatus Riflebacteria bacterium]